MLVLRAMMIFIRYMMKFQHPLIADNRSLQILKDAISNHLNMKKSHLITIAGKLDTKMSHLITIAGNLNGMSIVHQMLTITERKIHTFNPWYLRSLGQFLYGI